MEASAPTILGVQLHRLEEVLGSEPTRDHEPHSIVFGPSEQPDSVYAVLEGTVRVYRVSATGDELTLGWSRNGDLLGEAAVLAGSPRKTFAEAVEPSRVLRISASAFHTLMVALPEFGVAVSILMERRLATLEDRMEELVFHGARSRLARAIVRLADDFGREGSGELTLDLPLTQGVLATLVGTTRQTVNECLRVFGRQGLTRRDGRQLIVVDLAGLRQVSEAESSAPIALGSLFEPKPGGAGCSDS